MKFYTEDGAKIDKSKFIKYYNERYYLDAESIISASNRSVFKNSDFIENQIDQLLKNGIKDANDIIHILAWKAGKIKHKNSEKNKRFEYYSNWLIDEEKKDYQIIMNNCVDLKPFAEYIVKNMTAFESELIDDSQKVINKLKDKSPKGIGTVYLITLLYFMSKGELPIYDRFAKIAVDAILNNKKPNEYILYLELPNKNDEKFGEVINIYNENYVERLNEIFGNEYIFNRDIDRALWVYGHLFASDKKKCT